MSETPIPPVLAEIEAQPAQPRWRWGVHLFILAAYVLALGIAGAFLKPDGTGAKEPAMPGTVGELAKMCAVEIALFVLIFAIACAFSRATPRDLLLKWRGGFRPILWGIAYSVALRFVIMIVVIIIAAPIVFFKGEKAVEGLRPKTEALVNTEALKDPVYVLFAVTVVSFGMAGFREELWESWRDSRGRPRLFLRRGEVS